MNEKHDSRYVCSMNDQCMNEWSMHAKVKSLCVVDQGFDSAMLREPDQPFPFGRYCDCSFVKALPSKFSCRDSCDKDP